MIFVVLNLIFLSAVTGLIIYSMQVNDNRHADSVKLEAAIAASDKSASANTDRLVNKTIDASNRNYLLLVHRSNISNHVFADILAKLEQGAQNLTAQHHQVLLKIGQINALLHNKLKVTIH